MRSKTEPLKPMSKYKARDFMRLLLGFGYARESSTEQTLKHRYGQREQDQQRSKRITEHRWREIDPETTFFDARSGTERMSRVFLEKLIQAVSANWERTGQPCIVHVARVDRIARDDEDAWSILNALVIDGHAIVYFAHEDIACGLDEGWRAAVRPHISVAATQSETQSMHSHEVNQSIREHPDTAEAAFGNPPWGFELDRSNRRFRPHHSTGCPHRPEFNSEGRRTNPDVDPWRMDCPSEGVHDPVSERCAVPGTHLCALVLDGVERLFCPVRGRVLICDLYRDGSHTERSLALEMNRRGWRVVRRRQFQEGQEGTARLIRHGLIHLALTDPIVVGTYRRDRKGEHPTDLEGWIRPVLEMSVWNRIQHAIKPRHRSPSTKNIHLLEDLAKCAKCELKLTMSAARSQSVRAEYRMNHPYDAGCTVGESHQWTMGELPIMEALIEEARWLSIGPERMADVRAFLDAELPQEHRRSRDHVIADIQRLNEMRSDRGYDYEGGRAKYRAELAKRHDELARIDQLDAHVPTEAAVHKLATLADVLYRGYRDSRNTALPVEARREVRVSLKALLSEMIEAILIRQDPITRDPVIAELRLTPAYEDLWSLCSIRVSRAQSGSDEAARDTLLRRTPRMRAWFARETAA